MRFSSIEILVHPHSFASYGTAYAGPLGDALRRADRHNVDLPRGLVALAEGNEAALDELARLETLHNFYKSQVDRLAGDTGTAFVIMRAQHRPGMAAETENMARFGIPREIAEKIYAHSTGYRGWLINYAKKLGTRRIVADASTDELPGWLHSHLKAENHNFTGCSVRVYGEFGGACVGQVHLGLAGYAKFKNVTIDESKTMY